jgi:hypothetical protein
MDGDLVKVERMDGGWNGGWPKKNVSASGVEGASSCPYIHSFIHSFMLTGVSDMPHEELLSRVLHPELVRGWSAWIQR